MDIQKEIRLRLTRSGPVTAIVHVGSISTGGRLPEGTKYPAITIQTDETPEVYLDGALGLRTATLTVNVYEVEDTSTSAVENLEAIRDALKTELHGARGAMGEVQVRGIFWESTGEIEIDGDSLLASVSLRFTVIYREG